MEIPPERSAPWHSVQELLPSLAMKFSVAAPPCDPPVGRTNHPGTEDPGAAMWFTVPPLAPLLEVLAVEHPAPATARSSSNPIGIRIVRSEAFLGKNMSPPVPFFIVDGIGYFPFRGESRTTVIILHAKIDEEKLFY